MPFAYVASIVLGELGVAVRVVACEPFWEDTLGELVIGRAATGSIEVKMALDEKALKLDRRLEVRGCEEVFNLLTKLRCLFDVVKMLVPVLRGIGNQMMVFYVIFEGRQPLSRISRQKLRIFVLR